MISPGGSDRVANLLLVSCEAFGNWAIVEPSEGSDAEGYGDVATILRSGKVIVSAEENRPDGVASAV